VDDDGLQQLAGDDKHACDSFSGRRSPGFRVRRS
jgi:hypothetical protein